MGLRISGAAGARLLAMSRSALFGPPGHQLVLTLRHPQGLVQHFYPDQAVRAVAAVVARRDREAIEQLVASSVAPS